jgi:hypothetical protein
MAGDAGGATIEGAASVFYLPRREMGPLSRLEALIGEIVERPAWLLSPRKVHPLELSTALTRALEERAIRLADRVLAPDDYTLTLNPADLAAFGDAKPTLESELAGYLARLVVERDLSCNRAPRVAIVSSDAVRSGRTAVEARFSAPPEAATIAGTFAGRRPSTAPRETRPSVQTRAEKRPQGPALLLLDAGGEMQAAYVLDRGPVTIGRKASAEVSLADAKVSREHARIVLTADGYTITDLDSLNGTFVAGERITGSRVLRDGDSIAIGHSRFRFNAGR